MRNLGDIVRLAASLLGSKIIDRDSGEYLGKALLFTWRGKLWVVGYTGSKPLRPVVTLDPHVRYWRQSMGFCAATSPDYEKITQQHESE